MINWFKNHIIAQIIIFFSFFIIIYLALTGNLNQSYNDCVVGLTSAVSSNKSAEIFLLYFLSFSGILWYAVHFFKNIEVQEKKEINSDFNLISILYIIAGIILIQFIFFLKFDVIWSSLLLFAIIAYIKNKEHLLEDIVVFFMSLYSTFGIYKLCTFYFNNFKPSFITIILIAFIISLIPLKNNKLINKTILTLQLFIPSLLSVFILNRYHRSYNTISLPTTNEIKVFIFSLICIFIVEAIILIKKHWNKNSPVSDIISYGACICTAGFNWFVPTEVLKSEGLRHFIENVIGYYQIFKLGQSPYEDFISISGWFSILNGAFFDFFGHGEFGQIFNVENITFLMFLIVTAILIKKLTNNGILSFLIMIFMWSYHYNRFILSLPIMLLLSLPKLIENKNLWLALWFITSFINFLYYPLFGAAVCLAFLPLGIYQTVTLIKSGEFKKLVKTPNFYITWLLCFTPVVLLFKILIGTIFTIKYMADQKIYIDAVSRFALIIPDKFLPYLSIFSPVKLPLYLVLTFLFLAIPIWLAFALTLEAAGIKKENNNFIIQNIKNACIASSAMIFLLITYTYTVIPLSEKKLLAKNSFIIEIALIMLIIYSFILIKNKKTRISIITYALTIITISFSLGIEAINKRLKDTIFIPPEIMYVQNDSRTKIGTAFVEKPLFDEITMSNVDWDKSKSYYAIGSFAIYYINDLKGCAALETLSTKGYNSTKETIKMIKNKKPVIKTDFMTLENYYFYYWLVSSNEYYWDKENRTFYPNNNKYSDEAIAKMNSNIDKSAENNTIKGFSASSFGNSLKTLLPVFTEKNFPYEIIKNKNNIKLKFSKEFSGNDFDYIYLIIKNDMKVSYFLYKIDIYTGGNVFCKTPHPFAKYFMKKTYNANSIVKIKYYDEDNNEYYINASLGNGKVLIPLGPYYKWLRNNHKEISVSVFDSETGKESLPEISEIKLLKLREVE